MLFGSGDEGKLCRPVNLNVLVMAVPYFKAEIDPPVLTLKI
jgi:hypothetical protein